MMKRLLSIVVLLLAISIAMPALATKTCTHLTRGSYVEGGTTTAGTESISPAAGAVTVRVLSFDTETMSVSGAGLTWTTRVNGTVVGDGARMWIFIGASASPSAGPLTFTFDNDAFIDWSVTNITGTVNLAAPSTANALAANGTGTALAVTLSAFSNAANGVIAYGIVNDSTTITQGTGFTSVNSSNAGAIFGYSDITQCTNTSDTSVDATSADSAIWSFVAVEIADSTGTVSPLLLIRRRH